MENEVCATQHGHRPHMSEGSVLGCVCVRMRSRGSGVDEASARRRAELSAHRIAPSHRAIASPGEGGAHDDAARGRERGGREGGRQRTHPRRKRQRCCRPAESQPCTPAEQPTDTNLLLYESIFLYCIREVLKRPACYGLTEERLVALLKRWSKAPWRKTADGLKKMDQLD